MQVTRITNDNLEYFRVYLPPGRITPRQEALGLITEDGYPCAAALLSGENGDAALDWFFVHPEYRRKGVGSEFLTKIESLLEGETDVFTVSYPVVTEGMDDFLYQNRYLLTEGDSVYTVPLASIRKEPEAKRIKNMAEKQEVRTLTSLNEEERAAFFAFLDERFGGQAAFFRCDPKLSFAAYDMIGRVSGAVLITRQPELKTLFISALAGRGKAGAWGVLGKALQTVEKDSQYDDYRLQFISANERIDHLSQRIKDRIGETEVSQMRYAVKVL